MRQKEHLYSEQYNIVLCSLSYIITEYLDTIHAKETCAACRSVKAQATR